MKKAVVLLLIVAITVFAGLQVYAEGIAVSSENGDKVNLLEDVTVDKPITGNVVVVLGNVSINSKVDGIVVTVFGDMTINSDVTGQAVTIFGKTKLLENANVGSLITLGSVEKMDGAHVKGQEVRIFGEVMNLDIGAIMYLQIAIMLLFSISVLLLGLLILALKRKKYEKITDKIEYRVDRKLILGFLAFFSITILMIMLAITLIAPIIYFIILVLASITSSIFFGRLILKALNPSKNIFAEFITGLVTITLVRVLLINIMPQNDIVFTFIMLGIFEVFISSLGLGVLMEARESK
jgi:hypothetical protein